MRHQFQTAIAVALIFVLIPWPSSAKTRKGEALISRARQSELKDSAKDLDEALAYAQAALATDRGDISYQLEVARLRAFAAQYHVYDGQVLRGQGKIKEALVEFEKAAALDPASIVAPQELDRTRDLVKELRRNPSANADDLLMRPLPRKNKNDEAQFSNIAPVPRLTVELHRPLPSIVVNNQVSGEVFQAVCRAAKIRVLFDPDYQSRPLGLNQALDFHGATLDQALDYLALVTKSFWKPVSDDTIFVTNDDPARRAAYEEQVTKAFYLTNAPGAQEVNDIANTVQRVTDMKKLQVHPGQNVIIARGDTDRIALAEKVVADLDKPKAEIIIDVVILSVSRNWERQLGVNLIGLADNATNILFNPTAALNPAQVGGRTGIPLDVIDRLGKGDYNVTLPGAALNALLKIGGTKVMDKAQLRTIEGQKSILRIGQRIPYATGSFSPGSLSTGSSLVNTQFQYFDVGLNIDVIAKVHEPDEVSLHIESDSSAVQDRIDLGGVLQPVISQRKRIADVRVKEGEINFWDIVTQRQDVKASNGVPGLSQIPVLGRAFTSEKLLQTELQVLTLLIPHIIRAPDIRNVNLIGLPSGSDQVVRLRYQTPEGRTVASQTTDEVLKLAPGPPPQPQQMMGSPYMGSPMPGGMMGGPTMGAPQMGAPQMGIPGMGTPTVGAPQMGIPGMGTPPMGSPIPGMGGPAPNPTMGMPTNSGPGGMAPGPANPGAMMPGTNPMGVTPGQPQPGMTTGPGTTQPGSVPVGLARIYFQPSEQRTAPKGMINAQLMLSPADLASGSLTLQFDPKILRLAQVASGISVVANPDRENGRVELQISSGSGERTLVMMTFEAQASGATRIDIQNARLVGAAGAEVPSTATPAAIEVVEVKP